jgi:D-alanyl-D-alanine dipeptidase
MNYSDLELKKIEADFLQKNNLTKITEEEFGVNIDLRYATVNNVCEQKLYNFPFCYLQKDAAQKLKIAADITKKLGLKIKIWDAYRPFKIQEFMFKKFSHDRKYEGFISDPKTGSTPHCRGIAIDLTLINEDGKELDMGTDFDDFSELAHHNCQKVSVDAQRNRLILLGLMTLAGWDLYSQEWWHYQLFNPREFKIVEDEPHLIASKLF